jgi:hypothetical protein
MICRAEAPPLQGRINLVWARRAMAARGKKELGEMREGVVRSTLGAR